MPEDQCPPQAPQPESSEPSEEPTPFERFQALARRIVSVPKQEADKQQDHAGSRGPDHHQGQ
jgi:hypothetical protein